MSSKQKIVVSFAERVGIMDVSYMSETAQRLEARHSLVFYKKKPHCFVKKPGEAKVSLGCPVFSVGDPVAFRLALRRKML